MKTLAAVLVVLAACAPEPSPAIAGTAPAPASAAPSTAAARTPAASPAPSTPTTPDDVVTAGRAPFDTCYAKARAEDPKLGPTKVEMTFAIDADGKPKTVDFKYHHRFEDHAKDCMRDAALGLHFPGSMQGAQTATIVLTPPAP
jgi:hypothetical protein